MTRFSLPSARTARCVTLVSVTALAAALLAGCGGAGNTSAARIRAVNASTDTGISDILVNGSASYGDQSYFATSGYFYISTGSSTFTAATNTATTAITARSNTYTLSSGNFYTAYLVGRSTATGITDNRYTEVLVSDDAKPTLAAGQAAVRVIDAAPDAGAIDILINGAAPSATFTDLTFQVARDNQFVGTYVPVTAGALSVQVNKTSTSTAIIPAISIPVQAGHAYTILVTEPTGGTALAGVTGGTAPTFALQTTTE